VDIKEEKEWDYVSDHRWVTCGWRGFFAKFNSYQVLASPLQNELGGGAARERRNIGILFYEPCVVILLCIVS